MNMSVIEHFWDIVQSTYRKNYRNEKLKIDDLSEEELIVESAEILYESLINIRSKSYSRTIEFEGIVIGGIADVTHNIPKAISDRDKKELKRYIVEYRCFLIALKMLQVPYSN